MAVKKKNRTRINLGSSSHLYLLPGRTAQPSSLCVDFSIVSCYGVPVYVFVLEFISSFSLGTSGKGKQKECRRQTMGGVTWDAVFETGCRNCPHEVNTAVLPAGDLHEIRAVKNTSMPGERNHRAPPPLESNPLRFMGAERQLWLWMAKQKERGGK